MCIAKKELVELSTLSSTTKSILWIWCVHNDISASSFIAALFTFGMDKECKEGKGNRKQSKQRENHSLAKRRWSKKLNKYSEQKTILAFFHSLYVDCLSLFDIWFHRTPRVAFNLFNAVKSLFVFLNVAFDIYFLLYFWFATFFFRRIEFGLSLFCTNEWNDEKKGKKPSKQALCLVFCDEREREKE